MNEQILSCMPFKIKQALTQVCPLKSNELAEIRIRIGRPIELVFHQASYFLKENGQLTLLPEEALLTSSEDGQKLMNLISRHSLYALEEELRQGYITISGGHRIGIAGKAVLEAGKVKMLKDIQSFNLRLAREVRGVAGPVLPYLVQDAQVFSTLLVSPPRSGKTTLLRDLVRLLSSGVTALGIKGQKIVVIDERSEIASCLDGLPQTDLGPRVDVLDACPKAEGMMMAIRSLSPDILVCDEIGSVADVQAILEALYAGVVVFTSAHARHLAELKQRPNLAPLFRHGSFERYVLLSQRHGVGTVEEILDRHYKSLKRNPNLVLGTTGT